MEEKEITKVEQFGLKTPKNVYDIEKGVDEIFYQYASRDMVFTQVNFTKI